MDNPTRQRHVSEIFIIATPTNTGFGHIDTTRKLDLVPFFMQKGIMPVTSYAKGVSRARTECLVKIKKHLEANDIAHDGHAKIFWWDDDCILDVSVLADHLAAMLKVADQNNLNVIANYKNPWHDHDQNVLFRADSNDTGKYYPYTDEELNALDPLAPLPNTVGGMGFCYVDVPLDYVFHDAGNGEDINFMRDCKIQLNYLPVRVYHKKTVYI